MIVDCHTHVNWSAEDIGMSEHLAAVKTSDACMVLAGCDQPSDAANKRLSEYISKHKEKMVGFAFVEPTADDISVKKVTSLVDKLGLRGVVLYCPDCGFHPTHSRAMRLYETAQQLCLPVFFDNDGQKGPQSVLHYGLPYLLDEVAQTFADLKIVIGNMGRPFVEQTLWMVAKHKNVYADLTIKPTNVWQVYNTIMAAYENGVMEKLLFGSGFPQAGPDECIETLLGFGRLLGDTNLPTVPRGSIRNIIERDTLGVLGVGKKKG